MDPITIAKLWLVVKPIQRIKARKAKKRKEYTESEDLPVEDTLVTKQTENKVIQEIVGLTIRHGLTWAGGAGLASDDDLTRLVSALATAIGIGWSIWRKYKRAAETK